MHGSPRRIGAALLATLLAVAAAVLGPVPAQAAAFPDVIPLPDGFSPEGVATGAGTSVYVGSLRDGDIWRGDLRSGAGELFVDAPPGRIAVGLAVDVSSSLLLVAGGPTGQAFVYDSRTGDEVAAVTLTTQPATFVNDVTVTSAGAWFTDSQQPVLYFLPIAHDGSLGDVQTLPLSGPAAAIVGPFNLNGIDATPDGSRLVVAHSGLAALMVVDPATGQSWQVDLGGEAVPNADGILLDGPRLWVVQNSLNQVAEVRLRPDLTTGTVVSVRTDPDFRVPTTIARHGDRLVAVNARFDLGVPGPLDAEYELVLLRR